MSGEVEFEAVANLVFDYYGEQSQCIKFIEELAELTRELSIALLSGKPIMESDRLGELIDELADVSFMAEQFRQHVGHTNVDERMIYKRGRTVDRINQEVALGRNGTTETRVAESETSLSEPVPADNIASNLNGDVHERPNL